MDLERAFDESDALAEALLGLVDLPLCNDSARVEVADVACSLAIEHWHATRLLLRDGLFSAALVVHRSQFEAILRSIWLTYAASDTHVAKLTTELNLANEQGAKNLAQAQEMMDALATRGPREAHAALAQFKHHSWRALNSYAHAGLHPLHRHAQGYPATLVHGVLCNANGLAVLSAMQAAVLSGVQPLQKNILALAGRYKACMPPPL
jgi:hypothetical protein